MKFQFCGELDCPEWLLAEITMLAKLTSMRVRLLAQECARYIITSAWQEDKLTKILDEGDMDDASVRSSLAAVHFILTSSTKYRCITNHLHEELQQLGLPAENSKQLCKVYDAKKVEILQKLQSTSFKLPALEIVSHRNMDIVSESNAETCLTVLDCVLGDRTIKVACVPDKLNSLITEMESALIQIKHMTAHE